MPGKPFYVGRYNGLPGLARIGCFINIRVHVARRMAFKDRITGIFVKTAGFQKIRPGVFGQPRHRRNYVVPRFAAVGGELHVAIVSPDPNHIFV